MNNYLRSWENKFPRKVSCLAILSSVLRPVIINLKPVQLAWFYDFLQQHWLLWGRHGVNTEGFIQGSDFTKGGAGKLWLFARRHL